VSDFEVDMESMDAIMGGTGINDDHLRRATGYTGPENALGRASFGASLRRMTSAGPAKPWVFIDLRPFLLFLFSHFVNVSF